MRRSGLLMVPVLALALTAGGAAAQGRGQQPSREMLAQQIMQRFIANFQMQAGLTPDQTARFGPTILRNVQHRRELQQREQQVWQAMELQMRPGVAADADSVTKLIDAVFAARQAMLDEMKAEQQDYATFLNPVQRGQLAIEWERFQNQVEQMIRRRQEGRGQGPGRGGDPGGG